MVRTGSVVGCGGSSVQVRAGKEIRYVYVENDSNKQHIIVCTEANQSVRARCSGKHQYAHEMYGSKQNDLNWCGGSGWLLWDFRGGRNGFFWVDPPEAMNRPDWPNWKIAMDEELALMTKYEVWDEVDKPDDTNVIGCRWVFRIKHDANGKTLKHRARMVGQGFIQLYGVDLRETFAPVPHLSSIRAVIALAASEDWEIHQMYVKSAYLNSPIDATIYMRLPPGYGSKGKVARVKKGIYGLRQSGNLWHKTLATTFSELELTRSAVDHGVFCNHDNEGTTIVCSSTDDFAITGTPTSRSSGPISRITSRCQILANLLEFLASRSNAAGSQGQLPSRWPPTLTPLRNGSTSSPPLLSRLRLTLASSCHRTNPQRPRASMTTCGTCLTAKRLVPLCTPRLVRDRISPML